MMWGLLPILLIGRLYVTQQTTDCCNQPVIDLTDTNASQSSTSANYNQLTNPDRASDGNRATCSLTLIQNNSWWRIDLQGVHNISCVCIYNKNCSRLNLKPAEIYVGYSLKDNGKLAYNITEFKAGQINVFKFPKSVFGRYVTVVRPGQKAMVLCDVNITGTTIKPPFCDDD